MRGNNQNLFHRLQQYWEQSFSNCDFTTYYQVLFQFSDEEEFFHVRKLNDLIWQ